MCNPNTFTDQRDGKTYKTVQIGSQIWMAENLDYDTGNYDACMYHENNPSNVKNYGRLYTFEEALKACPNGWHLSTYAEWQTLKNFVNGLSAQLKANNGWNNNGNSTNSSGFSALPGGRATMKTNDYFCQDDGTHGHWWSYNTLEKDKIYYISVSISYEGIISHKADKDYIQSHLLSVRCVKN
jgi:uncharacterized protein (TIGR02145 family)